MSNKNGKQRDDEEIEVYEPTDGALCQPPLSSQAIGFNVLVPVRRHIIDFLVPPNHVGGVYGSNRTCTFWFEGGRWKACLRAQKEQCVAFFTGDCLGELFRTMEMQLKHEEATWKAEKRRKK